MIGPVCDGFRCGQKVRISDTQHTHYARYGYIVAIEDRAGYVFKVDLAQGKRPFVRTFTAAQLRPVRGIRAKARKE